MIEDVHNSRKSKCLSKVVIHFTEKAMYNIE